MKHYRDYDNFAWLYNRGWATYAERIFPILKEIAGEGLPDGAKVFDLCCGTGQLAKILTEKGYSVTGIDGSAEMLRYAKINAPDAEFIVEDARTFKLPPVFTAVFSTFDALNHILKAAELQRTFKNVNKCLVGGGIFIFDLNTERHFKTNWKNWKEIKENPDYLFAAMGDYTPEKRLAQLHITMFQPKAKYWKRSDVTLYETFYPNPAVKSALKKAGFTDIRAYAFSREHGLHKPTRSSQRIFYHARKP
jgi:SAM-dependent methyltransferase